MSFSEILVDEDWNMDREHNTKGGTTGGFIKREIERKYIENLAKLNARSEVT